jgi:hypothetical protein
LKVELVIERWQVIVGAVVVQLTLRGSEATDIAKMILAKGRTIIGTTAIQGRNVMMTGIPESDAGSVIGIAVVEKNEADTDSYGESCQSLF